MVERAGERFSFDVGLERISRAESGAASLPELRSILPSRLGLPDELARLVPDSQLRQLLEGFLNPAASAPELLMPGRFAQVFDGLRRRLDKDRRRDPELAAASELLEDERASRELLDYYRSVLLGA